MHAIALARPLAPGARTEVRFELGLDRGGVRASLPPRDVVTNGTLLMSGMVYPAIGYQPGRELEEPALRREHAAEACPQIEKKERTWNDEKDRGRHEGRKPHIEQAGY